MKYFTLIALLALGACAYTVADPPGSGLAKCYSGMSAAFCVVTAPRGTVVVPGTSVLGTIGGVASDTMATSSAVKNLP